MKLKIQLPLVASAFVGALILRGTISAGYSQVIPSLGTGISTLVVTFWIVYDLPSNGKEAVENEKEDSLCNTSLSIDVVWVQSHVIVGNCESSHRQCHSSGTEKHEGAASNLLNDEDRDERRHQIFGAVARGQQFGVVVAAETDARI